MKYLKLILLVIISFSSVYAAEAQLFRVVDVDSMQREVLSKINYDTTIYELRSTMFGDPISFDGSKAFFVRKDHFSKYNDITFVKYKDEYYPLDFNDVKPQLDEMNLAIAINYGTGSWYSDLDVICKDSNVYLSILIDSSDNKFDYEPFFLFRYNFVSKKLKLINHKVYDRFSKDTLEKFRLRYIYQDPKGDIYVKINSPSFYKDGIPTFLICKVSETDSIIPIYRQAYDIGMLFTYTNDISFGENSIRYYYQIFDTILNNGNNMDLIFEHRIDPITKEDVFTVLSPHDLPKDKNGLYYQYTAIPNYHDSVFITIGLFGEVIKIERDKSFKTIYPDDSLKSNLSYGSHWKTQPKVIFDKRGNIWLSFPRLVGSDYTNIKKPYNYIIRVDADDNIYLYDHTEYGSGVEFLTPYLLDDRYIVKRVNKVGNDNKLKLYNLYFDTYAASSVKGNTEGYAVGDIKSIALYPNPSTDMTNLKIKFIRKDIKSIDIKLYNSTGELIKEYSEAVEVQDFESNLQINTSGLPKGYYYVTIVTDRNKEYRGLIIK